MLNALVDSNFVSTVKRNGKLIIFVNIEFLKEAVVAMLLV